MMGSLSDLFIAAAFFVGSHFVLSHPPLRAVLVARLGEKMFKAAYSIIALAAIIWMVSAYQAAPYAALWPVADWMRYAALGIMLLAAVLLVAGITARSPTAMNGDAPAAGAPISGILTVTRHPVMWSIALWALAHMITNGDTASLIFFAAFAVLALIGMPAIDRRCREKMGEDWKAFEAATSVLPFAAAAQGRTGLSLGGIGLGRIAGGVLLYGVLLAGHQAVIGVSALLP